MYKADLVSAFFVYEFCDQLLAIVINLWFNVVVMDCLERIKDFKPEKIVYDSREVHEGSVFFALKGTRVDANDFVGSLLRNYKRILVVSEKNFKDSRCVKVDDIKECMGKVADWFFGYPSKNINLVGITGTNGKTTTTYLLKSIFDNSELIGTTGYTLKSKRFKLKNTTPESIDINRILSRMVSSGVRYCFAEVSSHAVSFKRIAGLRFALKVFTNVSQDHLDFYGTMENYAASKLSFFDDGDNKVVNIDDKYGKQILKNAITYGFSNDALIKPVEYEFSLDGIKMDVNVMGKIMSVESPLIGEYNIYNILAAIAVSVFFGVSKERIVRGIAKSRGAPGRLEFFKKDGVYAVVDYAHTDDAMRNVLEALNKIKRGRIITVFGAGGDRDKTKRPRMGSVAERLSDVVIVTSDNPRTEEPLRIIEDILSGIKNKDVLVEPDRYYAIKKALEMAKKGDIVAILGKGHEDYQILKDKTIHFDDREVVRELWSLD